MVHAPVFKTDGYFNIFFQYAVLSAFSGCSDVGAGCADLMVWNLICNFADNFGTRIVISVHKKNHVYGTLSLLCRIIQRKVKDT